MKKTGRRRTYTGQNGHLKASLTIEASLLVPMILALLFLLLQTTLYFHDTVCAQAWMYRETWKLRWNEEQGQTVFAAERSPNMAVLRHEEDEVKLQWRKVSQKSVWRMVMLPEFVSVLWNDQPEKREGTASESIRCPWEFMRIAGAIFEEWKGGGL